MIKITDFDIEMHWKDDRLCAFVNGHLVIEIYEKDDRFIIGGIYLPMNLGDLLAARLCLNTQLRAIDMAISEAERRKHHG